PSGPNHQYTSAKHFQYDAATLSNNAVMQNVKGKLAEAYTGDAHTTDLGFSYPNPGASEVDVYQSSTHSNGWYLTTAQHYANGATSVLTMPGGVPAITYGLDGEGRPTTVGNGTPSGLVKSASYGADGLAAITFGSGDSDAYQYDASTGRMAQYSFTVGSATNTGALSWNRNCSLGSLALTQNIYPSGPSTTCSYSHDDLGRIASVSCPGIWSQTFTLDPFGNVRKDASQGTSFSADFNLANQITTVGGTHGVYDPNGNLVNNPTVDTTAVNTFDSENRAVTLLNVNVLFDALGRAAEAGGNEILYGPGGGKLAVMKGQSLARADVPLPGGAEAVYESGGLTAYRHADQLGSAPLASTPSNTVWSAVGYAPYGEPFSSTGSDRSFTGQKQDVVAGQYDFLMRDYSPTLSRWWTPDPAGVAAVDPSNPQSFNRYAYVNGRPLGFIDRLGLQPCHSAALHRDSGTDADGEFGPSDDAIDPSNGDSSEDCSGLQACLVDGADVGCDLVTDLTGVGGGWGGGGSKSLLAVYGCKWSDCQGAGGEIDPWGNLERYLYMAPIKCTKGSAPNSVNCDFSVRGFNGPQTAPGLTEAYSWVPSQAVSMSPIGAQQVDPVRNLVVGFFTLLHPIEIAAANAAIFVTGGTLVVAGGIAVAGSCFDPPPADLLTCPIGGAAGGLISTVGLGDIGLGVVVFKNITVPAFREWGGGG